MNVKYRIAAFIYWLLAIYSCSVHAQESALSYSFRHLDLSDGLASNHVSAILQDRKGFIWIASTALQRYDGSNLITIASFDKVPGSIYYDDICLCEDKKGRIWMGAPDNIRYYDPVTSKVKVLKMDMLPVGTGNVYCSHIIQDHAGIIWVTTQEGLYRYDEKGATFVIPAEIPAADRAEMYSAIIEDKAGNLWISGKHGIYMLSADRKHLYHRNNNPLHIPLLYSQTSVKQFFIDSRERLWVAGRLGDTLYCYVPAQNQLKAWPFRINKPPEGNMVTDITEDKDKQIWLATVLGGIYRYDEQSNNFHVNIRANNDDDKRFHYDFEVNCFLNDRDGRLWIGTDRGLNILNPPDRAFHIMDQRDPNAKLPRAEVTDLFQDDLGNIYAGFWGKGFSWLSPSLQLKRQLIAEVPEERGLVWSFAQMPDGKVLVGQENGRLSVFDPKQGKFTAHKHKDLFGDQTLMNILPENDSTVWIGLYKKGLVRWNPVTDTFAVCQNLLNKIRHPITVMDIARQGDSTLWLATSDAGLIRYNHIRQKIESRELFPYGQLSVSNITCLNLLDDTTLIAGTEHGLWVYDIRRHTANPLLINGDLFDEWVLSMLPSGSRGLWFTTPYGFYRFNRRNFGLETFVQTGQIIDNNRKVRRRIVRLADGRLMIGASDHFVVLDTAALKVAPSPPDVTIINFKAMDSSMQLNSLYDKSAPLALNHRQNFINIEFKSLQYHHEAIRYFYQLDGVDEDWVQANGVLVARYTNLPPGNYVFRVRSMNTAGTFSTGVTTLYFNILPAFWQTTWFRLLGLLLVIAVIYTYFRIRIYLIKREARRRTEIEQQIAQLEMKALRAQMNPHFIFNALNSIQAFMMKNETEQALSYLSRFARLIRNVLDNSQQNSITISQEIKMLENYIELEKLRFEDQFDCDIRIDDELDPDYMDIPTMILQPFVENAIWHGLLHKKERGMLRISFTKEIDRILCTIEDNGIGREKAAALRTGDEHHSRGVQITQDRLALYNKRFNLDMTFDIEDLPTGTRVNVWFPLDEE
ncbi:ligand-binding sensor domain-containing protein [Chitinophaga sancti]|uniref:Two component regulator propeller n=1 Tax=Chitinophaga sancti TaxID=1004 RepID=A0A1K1SVW7_9BACT|nr:sensor histidine kinase [Chitinophaga sancti]WQD61091.1 two-component regulator propeller domain-containing protein [Chitinophaga sancti]WQG86780.1 two-component regulator propeller domain-containing protein [Chitinophaga sancti]SFW88474.1 Two component regulator propeller [Chitinophaga sancti]